MRVILASFFITLTAQVAVAACNYDLITIMGWNAEDNEYSTPTSRNIQLSIKYGYQGARSIRMLRARFVFEDVLGTNIGLLNLERDTKLNSGSLHEIVINQPALLHDWDRLVDINPKDVIARSCVRAVVYSDGSVEKF